MSQAKWMTSVFELWMVQKGNLLPNKKKQKNKKKKLSRCSRKISIIWYDTCRKWVMLSLFNTILISIVALDIRIIIHQSNLEHNSCKSCPFLTNKFNTFACILKNIWWNDITKICYWRLTYKEYLRLKSDWI
jgi:hypothetical protein